jgi:hypothetical protein
MCAKVSTAVRGLESEGTYSDKVRFVVTEVTSDEIRQEIAAWEGLGNHGLVGTSEGELKVMIPGHEFGRAQIIAKIDELLAAQ